MAQEADFETEGEVREYVESNPDEVVNIQSGPGQLWFGVVDGEFTIFREAAQALVTAGVAPPGAGVPHQMGPLGDSTELPDGDQFVVGRDETPLAA